MDKVRDFTKKEYVNLSIRPKTEVYLSSCTVRVCLLSSYRLYGFGTFDEFVLHFQGLVAGESMT